MATPVKSTPVKAAPVTDSPGTWRHPKLSEISRRRNATTFTEKNARTIIYNVVAILAMQFVNLFTKNNINPNSIPADVRLYLSWAWFCVQILPFVQIGIACLPMIRTKDELSDIPLTPAQRKLLGLPPSSAAPTPDAKYSTPPRYSRTPSIAGSVGSRASYASSPLSGRGSPAIAGSTGGSPYSPAGSPLLQKAAPGLGNGRRTSMGSPSPFSPSASANLFSEPTSPSPAGGKRTSVGLNSKWLYERGRRSSGSAWVH